ncbi:Dam family site-specific DNA-(adenine-N6)-methyltransferase [Lachnospiraceae bacterium]|nr:Dam family site-specific DNA-(adenine-N6)-methyltransferase [Lachnospiraceae bacterium]
MRYLGSKMKLLDQIQEVIERNHIEGECFADLFAGTGCVGDYFKSRYKIIANDFLYYSFVFNKAKLMNTGMPDFSKFTRKHKTGIFEWLNCREYTPDESFFVYRNYTPAGGRMFFTESNGIRIDGIRKDIERVYQEKEIEEREYYFLIASLLESVTRYSNTAGTYEAFLKFWDKRAEKDFVIEPLEINEVDVIFENEILNRDANELIREISGDIAYIDTPYTVTQYISAYHMLETIARDDAPAITGIGGKRGRGDRNSLYAQRTKAKRIFEDLFRQIRFKHILVSYSNQGLVPVDELVELARVFAVDGKVQVNHFDYREYQNHRSGSRKKGRRLNEVILYFEKDLSVNKSPLNYSGSKDTLLPVILKELPQNIDTFVDVMGGAFNVGANVAAMEKTVYNELNPFVYELMQWLLDTEKEELIANVEGVIEKFGLGKEEKEPYNALRDAYNRDPSPLYLYVLHMYAFQNMIRFNGDHKFNTPVGVAGYSEDIKQRLLNFKVKAPQYELLNLDYIQIPWNEFEKDTVFYFDPPYYITSAAYNDGKRGMKGWGLTEELELLRILKRIDELGFKFILSNVLEHKEKKNELLIEWIAENHYRVIDAGVSGWRYAKNEVLVVNY